MSPEDRERTREELREQTRELAGEARAIRRSLDEVANFSARRRRRASLFLALGIVLAIQVHDQHLDRCGVGSPRAGLSEGRQPDRTVPAPRALVCDATFPFHTHGGEEWPTSGTVLGVLLYLAAATGGVHWLRRAPNLPHVDERPFYEEDSP